MNNKCNNIKLIVYYGYIINFLENNITTITKRNIFDNKLITKEWLKKNNFPYVNTIDYDTVNKNTLIVIKPIDETRGNGIQIKKRYKLSSKLPHNYLAEEYIKGKHYRIVVYKGNIIGIILRINAFVVGDGIHTIKQLIDIKNLDRCTQTKLYCNDICYKNINIILEKNKKFFINDVSNYAKGGNIYIYNTANVHKDVFDLCKNIYNKLNVNLFGIDFICPNINISFSEQKCAINELELYNDLDIHYITNDKIFKFYNKLMSKWIIIFTLLFLLIYLLKFYLKK